MTTTLDAKTAAVPLVPFLPEFRPLNTLWEGEGAIYPSEASARWYLRQLREQLAEAEAVALPLGRLMVHPERFAKVARQAAIDGFAKRGHRD